MDIYNLLSELNIDFEEYEHDAVYTVEEAAALKVDMRGVHTKNLFLRDNKGKRHFLVVAPADKTLALKELSKSIGARRLGFASPERLKKYLGIEPGAVSPLAIINDSENMVELYFDNTLRDEAEIQCHPLDNTKTMIISMAGIQKLAASTGRETMFLDL
jgi:Ala-tRNA(Pro) deacylase